MAFRVLVALCLVSALSLAQEIPKSEDQLHSIVTEVALLKRVVVEQERRILQLEKIVQRLSTSKMTSARSITQPQPITSRQALSTPWHSETYWRRIKDGMSESQVIKILGKPTDVKDIGSFRTLFYRGEVRGSGFVSGNVRFTDDRVWQVNTPVF